MRVACRLLVAAALVFSAGAAARADEASDKAALARQVVDLAVAPGLDGRIARMIAEVAEKLPADKQASFREEALKPAVGVREELVTTFATYYASAFTLAELKELQAFFASPVGRKLVEAEEKKPPEVSATIQQLILKLVTQTAGAAGLAR